MCRTVKYIQKAVSEKLGVKKREYMEQDGKEILLVSKQYSISYACDENWLFFTIHVPTKTHWMMN